MNGLFRPQRIFVYRHVCDMRRGFFSLAGAVSTMGQEVTDGDAFVFVNGNRRRCKILWFDGTGLCLLAKRLDVGRFSAPWHVESQGELILSHAELALFFEGGLVLERIPLSPKPKSLTASLSEDDWK